MEPTQENQTELPVKTSFLSPLFKVTTVSKYFALALFVALPFIGGLVGYIYAPEKIVEIEKVIYLENSLEDTPESSTEGGNDPVKYYIVSEQISLDIKPFSSRALTFDVRAQRSATDPFFTDHIHFDSNSGEVTLDGYWYEDSTRLLLALIPYDSNQDLEILLEEELSKNWVINREISKEESNLQSDEFVRGRLLYEFPGMDFSDMTWRDLCELTSWGPDDNKYYRLNYDREKYEGSLFGFFCGGGSYEIHDGVLIYNPGMPIDAMEPKVMRGTIEL